MSLTVVFFVLPFFSSLLKIFAALFSRGSLLRYLYWKSIMNFLTDSNALYKKYWLKNQDYRFQGIKPQRSLTGGREETVK